MHIVCANCEAINLIGEHKNMSFEKCLKCATSVYDNVPVNLTDASFFSYIEENDLPVIVDFWADWCESCNTMAHIFKSVASASDRLLFAKIDTQDAQQVVAESEIRSLPTFIIFNKGEEVGRISGALREPQLKQWIIQCIDKC